LSDRTTQANKTQKKMRVIFTSSIRLVFHGGLNVPPPNGWARIGVYGTPPHDSRPDDDRYHQSEFSMSSYWRMLFTIAPPTSTNR
jgi:hypothetical protein